MRTLILILINLIFCTFSCVAESNAGSAEFAMLSSKWPCTAARESENATGLKTLRKAVLWNTFGTDTSCLEQYFSDPRLVSFQLHLINEVCQRNNQCGEYEFLYGITPDEYEKKLTNMPGKFMAKLSEYLKAPADLINNKLKPGTECLISPGLESNLSKEAARNLTKFIQPIFPKCKIVWNPVNVNPASSPLKNTVYESHGSKPEMTPPCNANLDGEDINFPSRPAILPNAINSTDIPQYFSRYKACENSFLWIAEFNGITDGQFIDPRQRTAFPTLETFNLVNSLIAGN